MATTIKKPISARRKLELSQLDSLSVQQEAMGDDVDFAKFVVYLNSLIDIKDLGDRITAASISRTVEGASTLVVHVNDYDRALLRSGVLNQKLDVQIDGLWFRYVGNDKNGDDLTLTFEDREIAILRTYHAWKIANRDQMTRAEFILSMLREVKEFTIPFNIPELAKVQPIAKYTGDLVGVDQITSKSKGIPATYNQDSKAAYNHRDPKGQQGHQAILTIKGAEATTTQIQNANIILQVGEAVGASRMEQIIAIMVAIQESTLNNLPGGDNAHGGGINDSAGLFQQDGSWGSYTDRTDPETSARLFYLGNPTSHIDGLITVHKNFGDLPYWMLASNVQHPAKQYETLYAKWRVEAERFVNAFGNVSDVGAANNLRNQISAFANPAGAYYFWRGRITDKNGVKIRKPENTWDAMQRLADEVDYRAFFVSGTFNYISEKDLFKQLPLAIITEFQDGIDSIDGSYDMAKKSATLTVKARVGRWLVPPGSIITLMGMGHYDGRWLVNQYDRDLIGDDRTATITLKKPRPALPEPAGTNAKDLNPSWSPIIQDTTIANTVTGTFKVATALVQPVPSGFGNNIIQGVHPTAGLDGYPAADFGANAGAPVIAVESGRIVRLSGQDPSLGPSDPTMGVHGPFGFSIYLLGDSGTEYYYTHLANQLVTVNQVVVAGQKIGSVGDYARWGGANHTHVGVHSGRSGHPDINDLMRAPLAQGR